MLIMAEAAQHGYDCYLRCQGRVAEKRANISKTSNIYEHLDFEDVQESCDRSDPFKWVK